MRIWFLVYAFLLRRGWIKRPVEDIYCSFVLGEISAGKVYSFLQPSQVEDFIKLHQDARAFFNREKESLPPMVILKFSQLMATNYRRFGIALNQVDALIEQDLEKNILRKKGKRNVVRREL